MVIKNGLIRLMMVFLLFLVSLTFTASAANTTSNGSSYIQLALGSTEIEIGDPLVVEGVVSDSIIGAYPGTAVLILLKPMESRIDSFISIPVNNDGTFSYSIPTDIMGTWTVSARYSGETSAATEVKVVSRTTMISTVNTLNSYGSPADIGESVHMNGFLRDKKGAGVADKAIKYMVALPPYGCSICSDDDDTLIWETYGEVVTDSSGHYSMAFTPYDHGQYRVKTYFAGDDAYEGSSSNTRSVMVN